MVTREEIEQKCKDAFDEAGMGLSFPEITPEKNIAQDLDIDSIHILETMILIEDEFDIMLDAEEFQKATTVRDLYDLVEIKIKQGAKIKELEKEAGDDEKARNRLLEQLKKDKEAGTGVYEMSQYEKK